MLAYRTRWRIKKGRLDEAVTLLQAAYKMFESHGLIARIYVDPKDDPRRVVAWEESWETPEAFTTFWGDESEVNASEEVQAFWAQWHEIVDGKPKHRVWRVLT